MEDFVTFEIATKLKNKGFNRLCIYAYCEKGGWNKYTQVHEPITHILRTDGNPFGTFYSGKNWNVEYERNKNKIRCSAPTIPQVLKWLREEKALSVEPCATSYDCCYYRIKCNGEIKVTYTGNKYKTYEAAALAGIEYAPDNLI